MGLWSLRTPDSGAILPKFPALLQTLTPMLALISTAIFIVLFVVAEHWWTRALFVFVWAFSMVTTLGMWKTRTGRLGSLDRLTATVRARICLRSWCGAGFDLEMSVASRRWMS